MPYQLSGVDAVVAVAVLSPVGTMEAPVHIARLVKAVDGSQRKEALVKEACGAADIGHVFFVGMALDVVGEVHFLPLAVKPDDVPGMLHFFVLYRTTRDI